MDICLSSNLNGAKPKPVLSGALATHSHRPPKFIAISCKAAKKTSHIEAANFYKTLSLSTNNAGIDEIKRAYRAMALKYHPDVCHPSMKEESARIFVEVHAAYKTLSDPVLREEYDRRLSHCDFARTCRIDISSNDQIARNRWEGQILELRRRSRVRAEEEKGSWGSKMRARNRENRDA